MDDPRIYQQVQLSPAERRDVHRPTPEELDRLADEARIEQGRRALALVQHPELASTGGEK